MSHRWREEISNSDHRQIKLSKISIISNEFVYRVYQSVLTNLCLPSYDVHDKTGNGKKGVNSFYIEHIHRVNVEGIRKITDTS